jgi:hypothetical protein
MFGPTLSFWLRLTPGRRTDNSNPCLNRGMRRRIKPYESDYTLMDSIVGMRVRPAHACQGNAETSLSGQLLTRTRLPYHLNNIQIMSSRLFAHGNDKSLVDHHQTDKQLEGHEDKMSFNSKYMTVVIPWPVSPVTIPALEAPRAKSSPSRV